MLQLMKIHRLNSLREQYHQLKSEALKYMTTGDLKNYVKRLTKASKVQHEYIETLGMDV